LKVQAQPSRCSGLAEPVFSFSQAAAAAWLKLIEFFGCLAAEKFS